jgi:signal-transduction protein with cAMP-binding, CBS, and nucleotidyltransferase domain
MMNLKEELQTEQVSHLELAGFCQVTSGATVRQALTQMQQCGQNVCLVFDGVVLVGIFTERDVLRKVVTAPELWDGPVNAVMTADPITVAPEATAVEALRLMDEHDFRNLPAMNADGRVIGNMTYQSIINYLAARYPIEILNLPPRPNHFPTQSEGGD